ncbi:hypothetical protein Tco_1099972 [Tanacetum coccineum]
MSDEDGVPETIFGSSSLVPNHRDEDKDAAHSDDPFGLYDLLKNKESLLLDCHYRTIVQSARSQVGFRTNTFSVVIILILFDCWIGDVPLRGNFISCSHGPEQKKPSGAVKHSAPIDLSFRRLDGSNTSIKVNIFGWQLGKIVYRTRVTDSQRPPLLSRYLSEFMGGALDPHEWSSVQSGSLRFFQFQFSLRSKYVGGVVFVSWWFIWNFRNQIIFEESSPDVLSHPFSI